MEDQLMNSELIVRRNCKFTEIAWHLASILLFLRRPVSLIELVDRCSLFTISPKFVEFLCSIPNSPIRLVANNLVVLSMSVFTAFGELFVNSMPKVELPLYGRERMLRSSEDFARTYVRKRKRPGSETMPIVKRRAVLTCVDENERETVNLSANQRILSTCLEGFDRQTAQSYRALTSLSYDRIVRAVNLVNTSDMVVTPSIEKSIIGSLDNQLEVDEDQETKFKKFKIEVSDMDNLVMDGFQDKSYANGTFLDLPNDSGDISRDLLLQKIAELSAVLAGSNHEVTNSVCGIDFDDSFYDELNQHHEKLPVESTTVVNMSRNFSNSQMQERKIDYMSEPPLMDSVGPEERVFLLGSCINDFSPVENFCQANTELYIGTTLPLNASLTKLKSISQPLVSADPQPSAQKSRRKSSVLENVCQDEQTQKQPTPSNLSQNNTIDIIYKEQRDKKYQKANALIDKSKQIAMNKASIHERCENVNQVSKDPKKHKFPEFEAYTVEQEEGSGGYGTVYKAKRKTDGLTFAIKCPHADAQKHHVKNELKMLERFGGKNYVIKLECSLKSENSDCFVLQHVEHDRPEVLKKEIDIFQLQRYGHCMFKALVSLHKQGVFHRDIKPGNFLFSSKTLNGYLIDFNLAKDLNQKNGNIEKIQPKSVMAIQQMPLVHSKPTSPNKQKKNQLANFSSLKEVAISSSKRVQGSKMLKKKAVDEVKAYDDLGRCNSLTSHGADGSGITSTRDMTSARTPSAERFRDRQPLPCKGRKALINLAQEAMQNPNLGALKAPASNRKRVAASPRITNKKPIYPTPIPLHSSGIAVSGAGTLVNRDVKPVKDGPCAGTKGFRAPEVLLRSLHQGPKVDVWSAGVTLLYLISGKLPFNGDPEQNLKDIVKLKGNEELWEVAKLHNRESSLPVELLDISFLQSMTIKDWCFRNTRRPDLLDVIPDSLFDLLEKCLTVSPRLRISAQEALNHEFFFPCHEKEFKYKRRLSRDQSLDSKSTLLPLLCEPVKLSSERKKTVDLVNF